MSGFVVGYIIGIILVFLLQHYIAKQFQSVAYEKGYSESKFYHLCFWLGLPGYLLVIALPDRGNGNTCNYVQSVTNEAKTGTNISVNDNSAVIRANYDRAEIKSGKCQRCHRETSHLIHCEVKGNYGVMYRDVCSVCAQKLNETNE